MRSKGQFILLNLLFAALVILANLIEHLASSVLTLMLAMGIGLWCFRKQPIRLTRSEKYVVWSFVFYSLVCLAFFLVRGLLVPGFSMEWDLDSEIRMLAFIPIFYLFVRVGLKPETFWFGISAGAMVSGIYACLYIYWLELGSRASGAYHAIAFGDLSIALGFMSLAGLRFFQEKHVLLPAVPLLAVVSGLIAAFLSGTRGAIFAAPLLTLVVLLQLGRHPRKHLLRATVVSLIVFVSVAGSLVPGSSFEYRFRSGVKAITDFFRGELDPSKLDVRLMLWAEAMDIIEAHPIAGIGKDGFQNTVRQKAKTHPELKRITHLQTPHNMYLAQMTSYGIAGLLSILAIFLAPLKALTKRLRQGSSGGDFAYSGVILIIAFMIFALTESVFVRNINIAMYLILTAAVFSLCRDQGAAAHGADK